MAWMAAAKNTVTVSVVTDVATAMRGGSGPRSTSCVVVASGRPAPMNPCASAPTAASAWLTVRPGRM